MNSRVTTEIGFARSFRSVAYARAARRRGGRVTAVALGADEERREFEHSSLFAAGAVTDVAAGGVARGAPARRERFARRDEGECRQGEQCAATTRGTRKQP